MKCIGTIPVAMKHCTGDVSVMVWEHGDPFPDLGPSVGVDTETELITDAVLDPPVVVLGVFDPKNMTNWIVYWYDVPEFMKQLNVRDIEQRYFNLGFDEQVLDNEDPEQTLITAIDQGRVRDMQIRIHLHEIATLGFIRHNLHNLAGCAKYFLGCELDKGDPNDPENSARMTFRRFNEDGSRKQITHEQAIYLPYDCISTWALGEAVKEQATEVAHTQGMVVLAHISKNGMRVDPVVFDAMEAKLFKARDEARKELLAYGFPDPYKDSSKEAAEARAMFVEEYTKLLKYAGLEPELPVTETTDDAGNVTRETAIPKKVNLRFMVCHMFNCSESPEDIELGISYIKSAAECKKSNLRKEEKAMYDELLENHEFLAFDEAGKAHVMPAFVGKLMQSYNAQLESGKAREKGFDFEEAVQYACDYMDEHPDWLSTAPAIGPRKFFQAHVKQLLENNPGLELETTEKSGEIKLTLKDMWRLEDNGITDKFLGAYTSFNHYVKYLSTYMNREYIKSDGKMHPRFTNLLRTGRTSSAGPNLQNVPARDKQFALRNVFAPPDGAIMCATDFSYIELCAYAQSCYTRFGYSVMRDVINAGLDPHRWFGAVMDKLITPDLSHANDPVWVTEMKNHLEAVVSKELRQRAKAANFGFPGALGTKTFLKNCREGGLKITMEEAEFMRNAWIGTFKEMKQHMKPEPINDSRTFGDPYGFYDEEEDETVLEEEDSRQLYICRTVHGMVRNRCTFNAACNCHFQSLTAFGAKLAGWELVKFGYADRLLDFIHDEYLYWLYPEELKPHIPNVERLMLKGMREAIPDVKVGVESSVMLHWDKGAKEFSKIEWDEQGNPIIEEPKFVQEVYGNLNETTKTKED